jgi:hypothetical protein
LVAFAETFGGSWQQVGRGGDWTGFGWRLDMIRTMTRVKRIPLPALFFVSAMEFILERAGTDLLLMTGALAILLWGGSQNP